MEEHGKVVLLCPPRQGTSARTGEVWASQDFVLHIDGRYERYVKLTLFGVDRIQRSALQLGEYVTAKFEIEAHEYQGNWFNELRCYDIVANGISRVQNKPQPQQQHTPSVTQQMPPQSQPFAAQPTQQTMQYAAMLQTPINR